MNESEMQFRMATFGGFQKQDVLDYLDRSAREQAEKLSELQKQLDTSDSARLELEESLSVQEAEATRLREEYGRLTAALNEKERKLAECEAQVSVLTAQVQELAARVQRLKPGADAYEALKDRAAGIELSAHSRAHEIEAEAEQRAKEIQAEVDGWFTRLHADYNQMKSRLTAALAHAGEELMQAAEGLESISRELDGQDSVLWEMGRGVGIVTGPKVPEPLPLEDDGLLTLENEDFLSSEEDGLLSPESETLLSSEDEDLLSEDDGLLSLEDGNLASPAEGGEEN